MVHKGPTGRAYSFMPETALKEIPGGCAWENPHLETTADLSGSGL